MVEEKKTVEIPEEEKGTKEPETCLVVRRRSHVGRPPIARTHTLS